MKEVRSKRATIAHLITIKSEKDLISNRNGIKFIYLLFFFFLRFYSAKIQICVFTLLYSSIMIVDSRHRFTAIKLNDFPVAIGQIHSLPS